MRQNVPMRTAGSGDGTASRASRSIDEWLDAAVAEQTRRSGSRDEATASDDAAARIPSRLAEDAPAGRERVAAQADPGASAAQGSMSSWIEKAQEELAGVARRPASDPASTGSALGRADATRTSYDALSAVERLDTGLDSSRFDAQAAQDEAFRNLESRIREIAGRLEAPKPAPARTKAAHRPLEDAVAEIRARQAALDETTAPAAAAAPRPPETAPAPRPPVAAPPVASPAEAPRFARVEPLADAGSELPRPGRSETEPRRVAETRQDGPALPPGLEGLRRDLDRVHGAMAHLASRSDLGAIERSIGELATELSSFRTEGGSTAPVEAEVEALQAEVRRLAGSGANPTEGIGRLSRDLEIVSHKLDIVAASGIDPTAIDALAREVTEVKRMLGGMAMPADINAVNDGLNELKLEIARIGSRQVDSQDFTGLRLAFEEMRDALSSMPATSGSGEMSALSLAAVQNATKDELQPIASMLVMLIDKIERLERYSGDPEMMEHIERQIAGLSATIGSTAARDPALSGLGQAMADLMAEVSTWRHGTVQIAEQAARDAVAQTLEAMRGGFAPHAAFPAAYSNEREPEPTPRRDDQPARAENPPPLPPVRHEPYAEAAPSGQEPASEAALRHLNEALLLGPGLPEADRPLPRATEDEVLLEPGATRPRVRPESLPDPDGGGDGRDVKASFIAAARRAAQAAAADADKTKSRASDRPAPATDNRQRSPNLRGMLDRLRRPLLVSAAALVFAIGGYRLLNELTAEQPVQVARVNPAATGRSSAPNVPLITAPPITIAALSPDLADPTTTQSVARRDAQAPAVPMAVSTPAPAEPAQPEPRAVAAPNGQAAALASASTASATSPAVPEAGASKQTSQLPANVPAPAPRPTPAPDAPGAAPASLKQAALNGDPVALYEMALRTMEGRGVAREPRAAVAMFEKAGEKNFAPAQYRAGNAYEKGLGVPRDVEAARRWYQRAAENGNTRAMHNLAVLMAEGGGGKPDYASAMTWFQKAAEHGVRDSQFNLAVLYARGLGTTQDMARSYTWFAIAAGQGDDEAAKKRDEVGTRLQPADLTRAKTSAERWRAAPSIPAANEIPASSSSSSLEPETKRSGRA